MPMVVFTKQYSAPADKTIDKIVIDADVINKVTKPKVHHSEKRAFAVEKQEKTESAVAEVESKAAAKTPA